MELMERAFLSDFCQITVSQFFKEWARVASSAFYVNLAKVSVDLQDSCWDNNFHHFLLPQFQFRLFCLISSKYVDKQHSIVWVFNSRFSVLQSVFTFFLAASVFVDLLNLSSRPLCSGTV